MVYFRPLHITIPIYFEKAKCRYCAWDSNPGPQDGMRRRIHWTFVWLLFIPTFDHTGLYLFKSLTFISPTFFRDSTKSRVLSRQRRPSAVHVRQPH